MARLLWANQYCVRQAGVGANRALPTLAAMVVCAAAAGLPAAPTNAFKQISTARPDQAIIATTPDLQGTRRDEPAHARAQRLLDAGDFAAAERYFSIDLRQHPGSIGSLFQRGVARLMIGRNLTALDDFNAVLELMPGHVDARYNRGLVYVRLKRFQPAIADFSLALAEHPGGAYLLQARGFAYLATGDQARALTDLRRAIAVSPHWMKSQHSKVCLRLLASGYDDALKGYCS